MTRRSIRNPRIPVPPSPVEDPIKLLASVKLDGGMNTRLSPYALENNVVVLAENCVVVADKLQFHDGSTIFSPAKPNSNVIVTLYQVTRFDGTTIFLRFTKNKVHRLVSSSWTEITNGTPYSILDTDRIRVLSFNDRFFFVTGKHTIYEINFSANTYAALGNAPKYKYITGFFNRIVGANLYDASSPNPTLVGWSGDLNFGEWNPATDVSAGSTPLLEAAADFADPIVGLFGFAAVMLILRERSLWTATKQPVASSPLSFQAAFPSFGCDCPNSATATRNGIVWYDYRSNQVYNYTIGNSPQAVGEAIRNVLKPKIFTKESVQGSYDYISNTYTITIPGTNTTLTYSYKLNMDTGAWTVRTMTSCNGVYSLDNSSAGLNINELTGTINQLSGTIDNLGNISTTPPATYYAMVNGDILKEGPYGTDNGTALSSTIVSKIYSMEDRRFSITRFRITFQPIRAGSFIIFYDSGNGWQNYKTVTYPSATNTIRMIATCNKHIRCRDFRWMIQSVSGSVSLLGYSIDITQSDFGKI